jgi:hypothetical protein
MVIKSESDYRLFLQNNKDNDLICDAVQVDERLHPCVSDVSLLFVYNVQKQSTYVISVNHRDCVFKIQKDQLIENFKNFTGKIWVFDKKKFHHLLPIGRLNDINIIFFISDGKVEDYSECDTKTHSFYKQKYNGYSNVNNVIPLTIHLEKFETMCVGSLKRIRNIRLDQSFKELNGTITENLGILEKNGLKVDVDTFNHFFGDKNVKIVDGYVYTQYNLYTSTGRPSNRFGNVNYSALNKENGCRNSFVSRHGKDGMLFMIDYSAYHPHLVAQLINYDLPSNAYEYLGGYYYNKQELSSDEIKTAKNITFQCMYGNIPDELKEIPYFKKINEYITHRWNFFNQYRYVETPVFKRQITKNHIYDPNPNKLFNYILQASETEFGIYSLASINEFLRDRKTKAILYTYDSILFDVHKEDKKQTLVHIKNLMENGKFPTKCYIGNSYNEMTIIHL